MFNPKLSKIVEAVAATAHAGRRTDVRDAFVLLVVVAVTSLLSAITMMKSGENAKIP